MSRPAAVIASVLAIASFATHAADQPAPPKLKQFCYMLKLTPRLHEKSAWTKDDIAAGQKHFAYLKAATEKGQVMFAGRTNESEDKTFGIVVFEAVDESSARDFMNGDEAVKSGIMTAELHPFMVALQRKS
jgi:uncharacterized protein